MKISKKSSETITVKMLLWDGNSWKMEIHGNMRPDYNYLLIILYL